MNLLLDTHAFLWWATDDSRLSTRAREVLSDPEQRIFFSAASGWEMAIKANLGKLTFPRGLSDFVTSAVSSNGYEILSVSLAHALAVNDLPYHHRDPFDRILVAQSRVEGLTILSADQKIRAYDIEILW